MMASENKAKKKHLPKKKAGAFLGYKKLVGVKCGVNGQKKA